MGKVQTGRGHGRAIGPDYMEVRFEDLVLHPEEALTKVGAFIGENLDYEKIRKAKIGAIRVPNTSFTEEWKSGSFSPVGRWKRQLSDDKVARLEGWLENFWWNLAIRYLALKGRHSASGYEPCERRIPPSIN
jgi:hypothetical protein